MKILSLGIVLAVAASGCLSPNEPDQPLDHVDSIRCLFHIVAEVPADAYVLNVTAQDWRANAPRLAGDLDRSFDEERPVHIGGHCADYEGELDWLVSLHNETFGANPTETSEGFLMYLVRIHHELGPVEGYPLYP